ncbi:MAG: 2-phosphosulfolactate phosphatase [Prevotellaceae bacterium]|jgi:2-phosphosulfolactate phosphatase|nr:2-phosphosulfolactate phosphatase [Prevotellaceae bacterium]
MNKIECCFSPALYPYYADNEDSIVVVVDIFRATTTICTAFAAGAVSVRPVSSVQEAKKAKSEGQLVGAERNADKCDFADFGNSPYDYFPEKLRGKTLVFTSTNGTRAINAAAGASDIIIGAFVNLLAVADYCLQKNKNVVALCAGWKNRFNIEDTLFGGALADILTERGNFSASSDAANVAINLWKQAKYDIFDFLKNTEHVARLQKRFLDKDIKYCLDINKFNILPRYDKMLNIIKLYN